MYELLSNFHCIGSNISERSKIDSSTKSNHDNELMSEQLLGFNINNIFETKARKNNIE